MTSASPGPAEGAGRAETDTMPLKRHFSDRFYEEGKKVHGPIKALNPTTAYFPIEHVRPPPEEVAARLPAAWYVWRSRDNRKGRHAAVVHKENLETGKIQTVPVTNTWKGALRGIWKMVVRYPVWDVSYDVAVVFTLGTVLFGGGDHPSTHGNVYDVTNFWLRICHLVLQWLLRVAAAGGAVFRIQERSSMGRRPDGIYRSNRLRARVCPAHARGCKRESYRLLRMGT